MRSGPLLVVGIALLAACGGSKPPHQAEPRSPPVIASPSVDAAPPPRDDGRLPPGARPTRYALDLTVDPSQTKFVGKTRIDVNIDMPTRAIVMHGRDLTVGAVMAETSRGKVAGKARSRLAFGAAEGPDELVVEFEHELPAGDAALDLSYEAPFAEQVRGLFRVEEAGAHYAFTHFEPTDARRMFPCFDEPAFKTPFQVTVRVPKGNLAFANAAEIRRTDDAAGGLTTFEFEPTAPLPTYLVAIAVGPLEVLVGPKAPVPLRVIAAKGQVALGRVAIETAAAHLELFQKYFDQPYPYGKLDLVAVPNFDPGGMENAGLITFREELLLLDGENASVGARRDLADAIGHEMAHHWFGNLVTMQWWSEIWLKESFTQWITAKVIDQWKPETKAGLLQANTKSWAMLSDALPSARKILNPIRTPKEIADGYNPLIFYKGAPLIGMVETWLGAETFRDGIRRYMKKHRGGSVTSSDLYAALSEASGGRDVAKVMETFLGQSGVPVVNVEIDCGAASKAAPNTRSSAPVLRLRQEEYRYLDRKETSDKQWQIPVCVRYDAGAELATACTLLDGKEGRIELAPGKDRRETCPSFVYPNAGEAGYYRFRLSQSDLDKLTARGFGRLSENERLGLVSNAWAAVGSGHLALSAYLELLRAYQNESSDVVLELILDTLIEADKAVVSDDARPAYARFVRDLFGASARRLGWTAKKGEPEQTKLVRNETLFAAGMLGRDPAVQAGATRIAQAWLTDPHKVDPETAGLALSMTARSGDAAMFERVLGVLKNASTPEVRQIARRGLTAFDAPPLVLRALDFTLDGTLKTQDLRDVLLAFVRRKATVEIALGWAEKHFDEITKTSPLGPLVLARAPAALCSAERLRAVETFWGPRLQNVGGASDLKVNTDVGLRCAALAEKEGAPTRAWLAARGQRR